MIHNIATLYAPVLQSCVFFYSTISNIIQQTGVEYPPPVYTEVRFRYEAILRENGAKTGSKDKDDPPYPDTELYHPSTPVLNTLNFKDAQKRVSHVFHLFMIRSLRL
jgi:hypothetical protein